MIHDLKPYPRMKDSGVPWLGQVPEHWEISASKWLFKASKELARPGDLQLSATQAYGVIPQDEYERRSGSRVVKISMHLDKRKHVEKDDFVISMRSFQGGLERAWASGAIRSSYVVLKPQANTDVDFYSYLLKSHDYIKALQSTAGFIRDGQDLTEGNFRQVDLPSPPLADQQAIGTFLAHADRRIRKAIAAKQKLIRLLQERKQVIIHQAVTRGLDPNVRLKPSGVEWLGDVPEGWEVRRLGSSTLGSINGIWGNDPDGINDIACIRVADFDRWNRSVRLDKITMRSISLRERRGRLLQPGDLLVEKSGGGEQQPVGNVVLFANNIPAVTSNFVARIPVVSGYSPKYLVYLHAALYSVRLNARSIKQTTGIQNLDARSYFSETVVFPSEQEQVEIVAYLDSRTQNIDSAVSRAQQEISLLREYRIRLIADVVTGKLDVRGAVAHLPEPAEEAVPEDLEVEVDGELEADEVEAEVVEA